MSAEGLEPSTNGLKGHCSTIELRARSGEVHSITLPGYRQRCPRARVYERLLPVFGVLPKSLGLPLDFDSMNAVE